MTEHPFRSKGFETITLAERCYAEGQYIQAHVLYGRAIPMLEKYTAKLNEEDNRPMHTVMTKKLKQYKMRKKSIASLVMPPAAAAAVMPTSEGGGGGPGNLTQAASVVGVNGLDPFEEQLQSSILTKSPNVQWVDVAGLEHAKARLREAVVTPLQFPHLFSGEGRGKISAWKGLLLYGPPGTGKSLLAKAAATEVTSTFISVSVSSIMSKYQGDSERSVRALFTLARKKKPCIIFIDEVDSLCAARGQSEANAYAGKVLTEFLVQMDGVGSDQTGVTVIGATNIPWSLDDAIRRRFQQRIYIPLPDKSARTSLVHHTLSRMTHCLTSRDIDDLVNKTELWSGSDLTVLFNALSFRVLNEATQATHFKLTDTDHYQACMSPDEVGAIPMTAQDIKPSTLLQLRPINTTHIQQELEKMKPSVSAQDLHAYEEWTRQYGQEG